MKKLLLLLLITSQLHSQETLDTIKGTNSIILYSQQKQQPVTILYLATCTNKDTCYDRNKYNFYRVLKYKTSSNKDYRNNIYDRGHMIAAETACCDSIALRETFCYLNIAMQHEGLNGGIWKTLDSEEKKLVSLGCKIYVEIQVEFINKVRTINGTLIPSGFYKKLIVDGKLYKSYYFPNTKPKSNNLKDYEI